MTERNMTSHVVLDLTTGRVVFYGTNWEAARMKYEDLTGRYGPKFAIFARSLYPFEPVTS